MAKKNTASVPRRENPSVSFKEIGSGITKHRVLTFTRLTLSEELSFRKSLTVDLPDTINFAFTAAGGVLDKQGIEYHQNGGSMVGVTSRMSLTTNSGAPSKLAR